MGGILPEQREVAVLLFKTHIDAALAVLYGSRGWASLSDVQRRALLASLGREVYGYISTHQGGRDVASPPDNEEVRHEAPH
jgi:hypothetical protein